MSAAREERQGAGEGGRRGRGGAKRPALYQCTACLDVRPYRAATCVACGTVNGPQPAPKGATLSRRHGGKKVEGPKMPSLPSGDDDGPLLDFGGGDDEDDEDEELEEPVALGDVEIVFPERVPTGIKGLDRVLGCNRGDKEKKYGAVRGAGIMLQGQPGIGKTTLTVQLAKKFAKKQKVLLATGEQSESDVALYATSFAKPTKTEKENLLILRTTNTDAVIAAVKKFEPVLLIVDSVQMYRSRHANGGAGSEPQCKYIHETLSVGTCKKLGVIQLYISQVTKEGVFKGTNALAHLVDVVMEFQRPSELVTDQRRTLCAPEKNRFGETGVMRKFRMTEKGLVGVKSRDA